MNSNTNVNNTDSVTVTGVTSINKQDVWDLLSQRAGQLLVFSLPAGNLINDTYGRYRVVLTGDRPTTLERAEWTGAWKCVSYPLFPQGNGKWLLMYAEELHGGGTLPRKLIKLLRLERPARDARLRRKWAKELLA